MAEASVKKSKRKNRNLKPQEAELDRFDSLPWNSSIPQPDENDDNDASFSLFTGSNELEGGKIRFTLILQWNDFILMFILRKLCYACQVFVELPHSTVYVIGYVYCCLYGQLSSADNVDIARLDAFNRSKPEPHGCLSKHVLNLPNLFQNAYVV